MASGQIEVVCSDSDPPLIQPGCSCRSDSGLAHVGCLIEKAVWQQEHRGKEAGWECQTCGQYFTGGYVDGAGGGVMVVGV